jgi:hypothetical protein
MGLVALVVSIALIAALSCDFGHGRLRLSYDKRNLTGCFRAKAAEVED